MYIVLNSKLLIKKTVIYFLYLNLAHIYIFLKLKINQTTQFALFFLLSEIWS